MSDETPVELIVVRSLTGSDLSIFAVHREVATSNQRAIQINAPVARRMLSPTLFKSGGKEFDCSCEFDGITTREARHLGKPGKNWRLGGSKIEGEAFAKLDSKDFMLIRTVAENDGSYSLSIVFLSRAVDRVVHAGLVAIVEKDLKRSMAVYEYGSPGFEALEQCCPPPERIKLDEEVEVPSDKSSIPPMPRDKRRDEANERTLHDKIRSPHLLERMLMASSDLSAPAQHQFMETVELLATQLRSVLSATGRIHKIGKNHETLWRSVKGVPIGFVDGGLANLSMLGSAPIAARVGGYVVTPGDRSDKRESFLPLKILIDELYSHGGAGVYSDSFPDIGALRDAARISIEAAGAVQLLAKQADIGWVFMHGALVNPVSRYTDIMRDKKVRHVFPAFSDSALELLLADAEPVENERDRNFISVHIRQLEALSNSDSIVCGVIERESTTTSVCRAVLESLGDDEIKDLLPKPPNEWKKWFRLAIDPSGDDDYEGQRITDSLLFRCVLEPGEYLTPVPLDRNEMRRAPEAWKDVIELYPKPQVSYLLPTEWNAPIRIEGFEKDLDRFADTASLLYHCALLLPKYAFPVGLDIVDKFAKIPNWMSAPVNTNTAVQALKRALDSGDMSLFDSLRRMLCGSSREWLLRPGINR